MLFFNIHVSRTKHGMKTKGSIKITVYLFALLQFGHRQEHHMSFTQIRSNRCDRNEKWLRRDGRTGLF